MLILAIETSTNAGSVALSRHGILLAQRPMAANKGHGASLLGHVDTLLSQCGVSVRQVDLFVASSGPGSFTGIRVGLSTAASLAWALGKPATAIGSLRTLAENAAEAPQAWVAPVLDARKREVYGAVYQRVDGRLVQAMAPAVMSAAALRTKIEAVADGPIAWLGDGLAAWPDDLPSSELSPCPRAAALCQLAFAAIQAGESELPPCAPSYVRPSEAEVKFGLAPAHDPVKAIDGP